MNCFIQGDASLVFCNSKQIFVLSNLKEASIENAMSIQHFSMVPSTHILAGIMFDLSTISPCDWMVQLGYEKEYWYSLPDFMHYKGEDFVVENRELNFEGWTVRLHGYF